MFASLFSVAGLSAAFDDAVIADAKNGRIFRPFAMLASTELGLPLVKTDGNPVNKAALLKLAGQYVMDVREKRAVGPKAWAKRVAVGRALETIASTMDAAFPAIGDAEAWEALKPTRAVKAKVKTDAAPAAATGADEEEGTSDTSEAAAATAPALPGVSLVDALSVVLEALRAGALSAPQRAALVATLAQTSAVPDRMAQLSAVPGLQGDALEFPVLDASALPTVIEGGLSEAEVSAVLAAVDPDNSTARAFAADVLAAEALV